MKFENNWRSKTPENLEKENWGEPSDNDSYLVKRTMELRRIPLEEFTTEDLRIMIGQEFSLFYLLPLAFEILENDLFAEGNFYPGDLMNMIFKIKDSYWEKHPHYWRQMNDLVKNRIEDLKKYRPSLDLELFYSNSY